MSLADELLADLEILDDARDERDEAQWQNEDKMEVIDEAQENEAISDKSVKSITKLLDSKEVCVYSGLVSTCQRNSLHFVLLRLKVNF